MPIVKFKGKKFILQWKPEWDRLVKKTAERFRNKRTGRVDWISARKTGIEDMIPGVSWECIVVRLSCLKRRKRQDVIDQDRLRSLNYRRKIKAVSYDNEKRKMGVLEHAPKKIKLKFKRRRANPTHISKKQVVIYKFLAKKYKNGEQVDWVTAMKDPKAKGLNSLDNKRAAIEWHRINNPKKLDWNNIPSEKREKYKTNSLNKKRIKMANKLLYEKLLS